MTDKDKELEENIKFLSKCCHNEYNDIRIDAVLLGSVDLITRKQAEIENLTVENQSLRGAANSLKMHYEEAQAEIVRLNEYNENLKTANTALSNEILDIKSAAVKEFAEQIFELFPADKSVTYISRVTIKHILKEMVGE